MANDKNLKQIYDLLDSNGQFSQTKSYDEFRNKMGSRNYSSHIWKLLKDNGADTGKPWEFRKWAGIGEFDTSRGGSNSRNSHYSPNSVGGGKTARGGGQAGGNGGQPVMPLTPTTPAGFGQLDIDSMSPKSQYVDGKYNPIEAGRRKASAQRLEDSSLTDAAKRGNIHAKKAIEQAGEDYEGEMLDKSDQLESEGVDPQQHAEGEERWRALQGDPEAMEATGADDAMQQQRDMLDYADMTNGELLKNPLDVGAGYDPKTGDVTGNPLYAPTLARDENGNPLTDENGNPIIGMSTDENRRGAYRQHLQNEVVGNKKADINGKAKDGTLGAEAYSLYDDLQSDDPETVEKAKQRLQDIRQYGDSQARAIVDDVFITKQREENQAERDEAERDPETGFKTGIGTSLYQGSLGHADSSAGIDRKYQAIDNALAQAQAHVREYNKEQDEKNEGWLSRNGSQTARGIGAELFNTRNWDFGISDLSDTAEYLKAVDAWKKGTATPEQKKLLQAQAMLAQVQGDYGLSTAYGVGQTTGQMASFMAQIGLGNSMGAGAKAGAKVAQTVARNLPRLAAKKFAGKEFSAISGRLAKDMVDAGMTTLVVQGQNTAADIINRHLGTAEGEMGKDGRMHYKGQTGGKDWMQSAYQGVMNGYIENWSEAFGEYFPYLGKMVGKGAAKLGLGKVGGALASAGGKVADKLHFGSVSRLIASANNSRGVQILNSVRKKAHFSGIVPEFGEEMVGGTMNALLVGDQSMGDVWSLQNMGDTALNLSLGCGFFSVLGGGTHLADIARSRRAVNHAGDKASQYFGNLWDKTKAETDRILDNAVGAQSNEDVSKQILDLCPNEEAAQLLSDYAMKRVYYRGLIYGTNAKMTDPDTPQDEKDAATSYIQGQDEDRPEGWNEIARQYGDARSYASQVLGDDAVEAMDNDPIGFLRGLDDDLDLESQGTEQQGSEGIEQQDNEGQQKVMRQAAYDYVNAKQRFDGMIQSSRDEMEDQVDAAVAEVDNRTNKKEQGGDGMIHPASMKELDDMGNPRQVYVVSGNVAMLPDGTDIDKAKSDDTIIIRDALTGKIEMTTPEALATVGTPIDAEQEKQEVSDTIRQEFSAQRAAEIDGDSNSSDNSGSSDSLDSRNNLEDNNSRRSQGTNDAGQEPSTSLDYGVDDELTITDDDGNPTTATVLGMDADGVRIRTESPVNGKRGLVIPKEQLDKMVTAVNGEAATVSQPTRPMEEGQRTGTERQDEARRTGGEQGEGQRTGEQQDEAQQQEQSPRQGEEQQTNEGQQQGQGEGQQTAERAIDRIPSQQVDDGKGNVRTVHNWEQAEPGDTYDALTEIYHGNADRVKRGIGNRIDKIDKAIKGVQKQMDAIDNSDDFDAVAAQGEQYDQLRKQKDDLQKQKEYWQNVRNVPGARQRAKDEANRKATDERAAEDRRRFFEEQKRQEEEDEKRREEERKRQEEEEKNKIKVNFGDEEQTQAETPADVRKQELGKAKSFDSLLRTAERIYGKDAIDLEPRTVEELVATWLKPHSLNFEGRMVGGVQQRGVSQELGIDKRSIGRNTDTNAMNYWLAPKGEGLSVDQAVHEIWDNRPEWLDNTDTSEIKDALLDMLHTAERPSDISWLVLRNRIDEAEQQLEAEERQEQDAMEHAAWERQQFAQTYADMLMETMDDWLITPEIEDAINSAIIDETYDEMLYELHKDDELIDALDILEQINNDNEQRENESPNAGSRQMGEEPERGTAQGGTAQGNEAVQGEAPRQQAGDENGAQRQGRPTAAEERTGNDVPDGGVSVEAGRPNGANEGKSSSLGERERRNGIRLNANQVDELLSSMEAQAENSVETELSPETWSEVFDENDSTSTPIGRVKMGEGQIAKFLAKGRAKEFGMVGPTLKDPDVIIEEPSDAKDGKAERNSSYVFVKTFNRNGEKIKFFASITIKKEGLEVSVSSHYVNKNAVANKIQEGNVFYIRKALLPNSSEWHLAERQNSVPDLLPTQGSNTSKDARSASGVQNSNSAIASGGLLSEPKTEVGTASHGTPPESSAAKVGKIHGNHNVITINNVKGGEKDNSEGKGAVAEPQHTKQEGEQIGTTSAPEKVHQERKGVNTEPTEGQKQAGNYKKGHIKVDGYDISIENPKGSTRSGKDANGKEWSIKMNYDYGYILGTKGTDGDHIDVYLSDNPTSGNVYVVDQIDQKTGDFDEHKVMYGFPSKEAAIDAYKSQYEKGWKVGKVTEVSREDFKKWVESSTRKTKPFSEYKSMEAATVSQRTQPEEQADGKKNGSKTFKYFTGSLHELVEQSKKIGSKLIKKVLTPASERLVNDLSKQGVKIGEEYNHTIDNSAINHALNRHSSEKERLQGQIPLAEADFDKAYDVVTNYDNITTEKNKRGQDVIIYSKQYDDGTTIYIEEVRTGRKELAMVSMRKQKSGKLTDANSKTVQSSDLSSTSKGKVSEKTNTKQEKGEKNNQGQFGLVSDERMEELKKRLRAKLNNLNMGVDPEVLAIGLELTAGYIDRGVKKFADYAKEMISDLGDTVRPYLKAFYNGVRDMPEITGNGLDKDMDDYETVSRYDVASIGKEGEKVDPSILDTAEQISNEQTVKQNAKKAGGVEAAQEYSENQDSKDNKPTLLDAVRDLYQNGKMYASKLYSMKFFDVAKTPDFMKKLGLTGDKFTIKYGVIARHFGKDGSHDLTNKEWEQLPSALENPFAISKLSDKDKGYRIYTSLQNAKGEYVVVGVDVKNAGRNLEVNAISTVFGRRDNANLPLNEKVIYRSEKITPEQEALLSEPNSRQYPSTQESKDTPEQKALLSEPNSRQYPSAQESKDTPEQKALLNGNNPHQYQSAQESKQAEREDGQLLILPSDNSEEAGALSSRTQGLSSAGKVSEKTDTKQEKGEKKVDGKIKAQRTGNNNSLKLTEREVALRNAINDILRSGGMDVIDDDKEGQAILDIANGGRQMKKIAGVRYFRTKNGEAYGFTVGGKIYIDPRIATAETPLHEYTHLWADAIRAVNPKEWKHIVSLMKGTWAWNYVKKLYPDLKTDDEIADEALAHFSGRQGAEKARKAMEEELGENPSEEKVDAAKRGLARLREALRTLWKKVCDLLHVHFNKPEEVADRVMYDMLRGFDPRSATEDNMRSVESEDSKLRVTTLSPEAKIPLKKFEGKEAKVSVADVAKAIKSYRGNYPTLDGHSLYIGKQSRNKLSNVLKTKGENMPVRVALANVPEILSNSILVEERSDRKKIEGFRAEDNPGDTSVEKVQIYYGGIDIDGTPYRVKTTVPIYTEGNNRVKGYEIKNMELTPSTTGKSQQAEPLGYNSISLANLLNEVDFSKQKGKKLLDEIGKNPIDRLKAQEDEEADIVAKAKEDGTYMKAPNGKDSNLSPKQWAQVRTTAFKDWFGDWENDPDEASQAVDENGEPKVFYHNTDNDFTVFDEKRNGTNTDAGWLGDGFYFYGDENEGDGYGSKKMEVFLNIRDMYFATPEQNQELAEANDRDMSIAFRKEVEDEGYDGVYYNGDLRQEVVVFHPEQIKSATNNIGTFSDDNPDIRYQLVDEPDDKTLMGVHNISTEKLMKAIRQGGLANPSMAVVDTKNGIHDKYGEISLIPSSSLIDKRTGRNAGTWTGDAYTPRYPQTELRMSSKGAKKFDKELSKLAGKNPTFKKLWSDIEYLYHQMLEGRNNLNSSYAWFLAETGRDIPAVQESYPYPDVYLKRLNDIAGKGEVFDSKVLYELTPEQKEKAMQVYRDYAKNHKINDNLTELEYHVKKYERRAQEAKKKNAGEDKVKAFLEKAEESKKYGDTKAMVMKRLEAMGNYTSRLGSPRQLDKQATFDASKKFVEDNGLQKEYEAWKNGLQDRYDEKEYFYTGTDNMGRQKYKENTLQNVSAYMKKQGRAGAEGVFTGFGGFAAKRMKQLSSKAQIRANKGQLREGEDERKRLEDLYSDLNQMIMERIDTYNPDSYVEEIANAANPIAFAKKEYGITLPKEYVEKQKELIDGIQKMPTLYFETKFERPVYLTEFEKAIVPDDTPEEVMKALTDSGLKVYRYKAGDEESRKNVTMQAVNESDDILFRDDNTEQLNDRFNEDIERYNEGTLPQGFRFDLGYPSAELRSAGFDNLPISMRASLLSRKAGDEHHPFEASDLKDLVKAIQKPIAIFRYSKSNMRNLIVDTQRNGKHFLVGVTLNYKANGIEINSVSGLFPKENHEWIKWIQDGKAIRIDQKNKVLNLINSLRTNPAESERIGLNLDDAAKIVEDFENPVIKDENLSREGDGAYSDEDLSLMNDPVAKWLGKSRRTKAQQRAFADRERSNMANAVREMADRLHLDNVEIVTEPMTVTDSHGRVHHPKGFYNRRTGKITIVILSHANVEDALQTLLHEGVAHYGLRQLFGDRFETFLDNVYAAADKDVRGRIFDLAFHNYRGDIRLATEEYLASLAENTNFEDMPHGFWQKIKQLFLDMLHYLGFDDFASRGVTLSDNELRYILWRSYENLKEPGRYRSIVGEAEDISKQAELKVGNYGEERLDSLNSNDSPDSLNTEAAESDNEEARSLIHRMVSLSKLSKDKIHRLVIGHVNKRQIKDLQKEGLDIDENWRHSIENSRIIHAQKRHGVTDTDFEKIPDILNSYDNVHVSDNLNKEGNKVVMYEKKYSDGTTYYLEEVRNGRKSLAFQTMYKKGSGNSGRLMAKPSPQRPGTTPDTSTSSAAKLGNSSENGVNNSEKEKEPEAWGDDSLIKRAQQISNGIEPDLLFRDTIEDDDNTARETYDRLASEKRNIIREAWQDSMINVRNLQDAILKQRGEKLEAYEDAYNEENRSHGKSRAESEYFTDNYYHPLLKAVNTLAKKAKVSIGDVVEYMMAKHGLERNEVFAKRDAQAAWDKYQEKQKAKFDEYQKAHPNGNKTIADFMEKSYDDFYNDYREKDYSGLTALTGTDNVQDAEAEAKAIVASMEGRGDTTDLWDKTNAATKWTLQKAYESGIISRDNYKAVRDMFDYYVPLRGWKEDTAGDIYDYVGGGNGTAFSPVLKKAKGRSSEADNPIAYIGNMAISAITQGNKNKVKQSFLNFVENHPTNLVTVSEMWYRNFGTADNPDWREDVPNIPENATADQIAALVEQHEKDMKALEAQGLATKKRGNLHLNVPIKPEEATEHHVEVLVNGKKYVLYINGNPRAAQALNGSRVKEANEHSKESGILAGVNRWLGEAYTSLSPAFTVSNLLRDYTMATALTFIKEGPGYSRRFQGNMALLGGPARMFVLMHKYNNGTLDMSNDTERYFHEFMTEGAETGFTSLKDIDRFKEDMQKEFNHLNQGKANPRRVARAFSEGVENVNRCIEDTVRFATYMTSRKSGRSVRESVSDAKNITLNFNRKGSGEKGNATMRHLYIFVNPAIQSLQMLASSIKHHPVRFSMAAGFITAMGMMQPLLVSVFAGIFGGGGDGDDDDWNPMDEYWKLPAWQRRNNYVFWIPGTHKFGMIPLGQEFRALHGFGETLYSYTHGQEDTNPALELTSQVVDLLPLDFTGNGGNPLVSLTPSLLQPVMQVGFNTEFTGKPIFKDTEFNKYEPSFQKAYVGTPSWLVKASEMLNEATGGNDHKQGKVELVLNKGPRIVQVENPAVLDHYLKGYMGGPYSFLSGLGGMAYKAFFKKETPDAQEIPVVNRVVTAPREQQQNGKTKMPDWYYDMQDDSKRYQSELSGYRRDMIAKKPGAREHFEDMTKTKEFAKETQINQLMNTVNEIRAAQKTVEEPKNAEETQTKQELDAGLNRIVEVLNKIRQKDRALTEAEINAIYNQ